jgi:peptidoglycan hydrolase CwlO-like protein
MKAIDFIKRQSPLTFFAVLMLAIAILFPRGRTVTTHDLIKMQKEIRTEYMNREQKRQDSIIKTMQAVGKKIQALEDSIEATEKRLQKSEAAMHIQITNLNKLKNEIKTIDYSRVADSVLLNRLRTNN